MHYSEIEMAESMSTLTKISARNPVCSYVIVLMRVAIYFEYSAKQAYLKICIQKFIEPVAML